MLRNPSSGANILDERGEQLFELFIAHQLQFLKYPTCRATFETVNRRSWIDLSVASLLIFPFCCHWGVLEGEPLSDHKVLVGSMFIGATFSVGK